MHERYEDSSYMSWGRQEMVQLVVGLVHPREQGFAQRLSPVCQGWYSRSSDGVVITHSTKYNAHGWPFSECFRAGLFVLLSDWYATLGRRIR